MKINHILLYIIYMLSFFSAYSQSTNDLALKERYLRIMFYNTENFFDTKDDSLTNDEEFLPDGSRFWTYKRYLQKQQNVSTVITAIGGWSPPDIVGLCEIENRNVLDDLCLNSSLSKLKYKIIHKESPDARGIDVALLYQPKSFKPLSYKAIKVFFPDNPGFKTRDILYVQGQTKNSDTLHVFINHWPSRSAGQIESEPNRVRAATILRYEIDSIFKEKPKAKIVIMGDFNDYPDNISIAKVLNAKSNFSQIEPGELYNLSAYLQNTSNIGSHKFDGEWGILDQIIVSGSLLETKKGLATSKENAHIFNADFLLEDDDNFAGKMTSRTYVGFKYHGGFSDHLPVFLDIDNLILKTDGKN
jgi:predicted extracellular nuclease